VWEKRKVKQGENGKGGKEQGAFEKYNKERPNEKLSELGHKKPLGGERKTNAGEKEGGRGGGEERKTGESKSKKNFLVLREAWGGRALR